MFHGCVCPDNRKIPRQRQSSDSIQIHRQQRKDMLHLLCDGRKVDRHGNAVIVGGREFGSMRAVMQRAEGKVSGGHIAVLVSTEQALAPSLFAVVDLHNIGSRLLVFVAASHVYIVVDQFDTRKYPIKCNVPRTAFIFQMKAVVTVICRTIFPSGGTVQVDARESAGYRCILSGEQDIFCQFIWIFHPLITCHIFPSIQNVSYDLPPVKGRKSCPPAGGAALCDEK